MNVSRLINAPLERVWEILIDTRLWPFWGPTVREVESPQRYISAGLIGRVKTAIGLWVNFEITGFEAYHYWDWEVAGVPATGHRLRRVGQDRCELIFEIPLVAAPYALVCQQATSRIAALAEGREEFQAD